VIVEADGEIQAYVRYRAILSDDVPFLVNHNEEKWAEQLGHKSDDAGRKNSIPLIKFTLGFEQARRLDTTARQDG